MRTKKVVAAASTLGVAAIAALTIGLSAASAGESTVQVQGKPAWTDTGTALTENEKVTITAEGLISVCTGGGCKFKPTGEKLPGKSCLKFTYQASVTSHPFPAPGVACYSMIARIGSGPAFPIGAKSSFTSPVAGELFLGINQDEPSVDSGSWTAKITTP
jgi:hypothetical protein